MTTIGPTFRARARPLAPSIPSSEPTVVNAGDTWQWDKSLQDFPASDGWTLSYSFVGPGTVADIVASGSGSRYEVRQSPNVSSAYTPGRYNWAAFVSRAAPAERHTVAQGVILVRPNLETATPGLTTDEAELVRLDAAIAELESSGKQEVSIDGRSFKRADLAELKRQRGFTRARVRRARNPGRLGLGVVRIR